MQAIKAKDTDIELMLRKELWSRGLRYRKNVKAITGKPDIIDPREIGLKLDDNKNRCSALGEFKRNLFEFLEITDSDDSTWDYQRDRFLRIVDKIYML